MILNYVFSILLLTASSAFAQPIRVLSCQSGDAAYRSLDIYDDGRDYHIELKAGAFDEYFSRPILQTLRKGSYSLTFPKDKCHLQGATMACLSWGGVVAVKGEKMSGVSYQGNIETKRASFKLSQVTKKEIFFEASGPKLKELSQETAFLSLLPKDKTLDRIGALVDFPSHMKCHEF